MTKQRKINISQRNVNFVLPKPLSDVYIIDYKGIRLSRLEENVLQEVAWLESLANSDGYNAPARRIKIVFGKVFREEKWVVKTVATKFSDLASLYGYAPMRAEVSLSLSLTTDSNLTFKDIRR